MDVAKFKLIVICLVSASTLKLTDGGQIRCECRANATVNVDGIFIHFDISSSYTILNISVEYSDMKKEFMISNSSQTFSIWNNTNLLKRIDLRVTTDFLPPRIVTYSISEDSRSIILSIDDIVTTAVNTVYVFNGTNIPEARINRTLLTNSTIRPFFALDEMMQNITIRLSTDCTSGITVIHHGSYKNHSQWTVLGRFNKNELNCPMDAFNYVWLLLGLVMVIALIAIVQLYRCFRDSEGTQMSTETFKMVKIVDDGCYNTLSTAELNSLLFRDDAQDLIQSEHSRVPQNECVNIGFQYPKKNRYANVLPNGATAVKLKGEGITSYINANYVKDHNDENRYIATQGPRTSTVPDFWRMILEQNVSTIVMLTNLKENGHKKCSCYWPEAGKTKTFGSIKVHCRNTVTTLDYEVRTMDVGEESRQVTQYHYTTWPDHGIPMRPPSFVNFLRKILTADQQFPIVVHCSAGVGRTGAFILSHSAYRMGAELQKVDFPSLLTKLRSCRAFMIKEPMQYKLSYCAVNELINGAASEIHEDKLTPQNLERHNLIKAQSTVANHDYWLNVLGRSTHPSVDSNMDKNRYSETFKSCSAFVYLDRNTDNDFSDYINAVSIDKSLICTQQPLPSTIRDFWQLVDETNASFICSLHNIESADPNSPYFWPRERSTNLEPNTYLCVSILSMQYDKLFNIYTLNILNRRKRESRIIKLMQVKCWPRDSLPQVNEFGKIYKQFVTSKRKAKVILACCDGGKACGLLLTFLFVHMKIMLEKVYDICYVARCLRFHRDDFMSDWEHYGFIFEALGNQLIEDEKNGENATIYANVFMHDIYENV